MNITTQIEFDKIKEQWMALAMTDDAKRKIGDMYIYLSEAELRKALRDTSDARKLIETLGAPPLQNVAEIRDILTAAEKGSCLTPHQLEQTGTVLAAVRRLKAYLDRGKMYGSSLAYYEENLTEHEELREEIYRQIRNGGVDDHASGTLRQIREQIGRCEEQMKQKAEQIMRANKTCMADHYYTFRNGRICVPVKKEYKLKISGSVIDKSATGSTLFIEPASVAKHGEELQLLKISEENEVYRILYTLTAMVADAADEVKENLALIEKLDFIFSKGKLSIDSDAVEPQINLNRKIALTDARHPLMDRETAVPLQFAPDSGTRGIVITGPNTGGKTVAIKTVMLCCMMAQCGLHVTCRRADICMNSSYLCDIGDGQNLSENLSTFSAHIKNVLEVLEEVNSDSFVIMDELGSGTDPAEGMGIAVAILEELRKSGALFLVTTHYPEVKEYAARTPDVINARMTFDQETLLPTYQMVLGEAGESCAFYIADRLGMPGEMLNTAIRAAYGEEAVGRYGFQNPDSSPKRRPADRIRPAREPKSSSRAGSEYQRGDSVMVYPDKKIGRASCRERV